MFDEQDISTKIIILLIVITGVAHIYVGLRGVLVKKIGLKGNYRTPRIATGKYAVFYGLGMYLFGISFIYVFLSIILNQLSLFKAFVIILFTGLISTLLQRMGYKDPKLLEIEKTDKEIFGQQEKDPGFIQERKKIIFLLVFLSFLIGFGVPFVVFIFINMNNQWNSETIHGYSVIAIFLTFLCLLFSLRLFLLNKQRGKW